MARRLKTLKVEKLALCRKGKNGFGVLYKSANGNFDAPSVSVEMLCKSMTEEGVLTAVVYAPNKPDTDGHQASAEVIKKAAYDAMKDGLELNIEHEGEVLPKSDAYLVETFIVQKGDKRFEGMKDYAGNAVGDMAGSWAVSIQVDSEPLRAAYRSGRWQGLSLEGFGQFEMAKSEPAPSNEETPMTPEQIAALTASLNKSVTDTIKPVLDRVEALEKSAKKDEANDEAVKLEKSRKARRLAREIADAETTEESDLILAKAELGTLSEQLTKAITDGDIDEVADLRKSIASARGTVEKLSKTVDKQKADKAAALKKAQAPMGDSDGDNKDNPLKAVARLSGLKKSQLEGISDEEQQFEVLAGAAMGNMLTRMTGGKVAQN